MIQVTTKTQWSKTSGMEQSGPKRKVYSNTVLPPEKQEKSQTNLTLLLKQLEKEKQTKP